MIRVAETAGFCFGVNRAVETVYKLLEEGKLDIGLVGKQFRSFEFFPLKSIQDTFVASPTYLANLKEREPGLAKDSVSLLQQVNLMLLDDKNLSRLHLEDYFSKHNLHSGQTLEVNNMDLLIEFSKIGLGVGCVIREFVEKELAEGSLIELTLPHSITKRTAGFVYNKITAQNDSVKRFIDFYKGEQSE